MWDLAQRWIGPDGRAVDLSIGQMVLRAVLVFVLAAVLVRLGSRRFMGRESALDLILAILSLVKVSAGSCRRAATMLGSVLSRAINGQAPFLATLAASAGMVATYAVLAYGALRWRWFGRLLKGSATLLVEDGKEIPQAMQDAMVSRGDLLEALRLRGRATRIDEVAFAYLERDGRISIILKAASKV